MDDINRYSMTIDELAQEAELDCRFTDGFAAAVLKVQAHAASLTTHFYLVRQAILPL